MEWELRQALDDAARVIEESDGLLVAAGAGMGVDSGLPDFRGPQGFWRAYPPFAKLGLRFEQLANSRWFDVDPALAWGFYGHRRNSYRAASPHDGYRRLLAWTRRRSTGGFVFTSNVDGHFQRAGFPEDHVVECHGSIEWMQCCLPCTNALWPSESADVDLDEETMRARGSLARCPNCGKAARPNILMFGDGRWTSSRADAQWGRLEDWLWTRAGDRLAVVECGAGSAIPTVRRTCEEIASQWNGRLIRINPRETTVPPGHISLPLPALEAILEIDRRLNQ